MKKQVEYDGTGGVLDPRYELQIRAGGEKWRHGNLLQGAMWEMMKQVQYRVLWSLDPHHGRKSPGRRVIAMPCGLRIWAIIFRSSHVVLNIIMFSL